MTLPQHTTNTRPLVDALTARERTYTDAIDRLVEISSDYNDAESCNLREGLRECVELVRCLRRIVPGCSIEEIHRAFGAPGDFGYDTSIGAALARLYRGEQQ